MTWDKYNRASGKSPLAMFWYVFWRFIVVVIVVVPFFFILGVFSNPFRQAARIVEKTIDADNVIYNYEWFKQRHEDIIAIDAKIIDAEKVVKNFKAEAGERSKWHREDRTEHSRLNSIAMGLRQQRNDLVAVYNARSRMTNRNIFKTGDEELPERIK